MFAEKLYVFTRATWRITYRAHVGMDVVVERRGGECAKFCVIRQHPT